MIALLTFSNREWRPIASCRRYTTLIATCCVVLCVAHGVAMAQQGTPSHRLLGNGLPTLSGTQPQMELLLRLQKLAGAAQAAGTEIPGLQNPDSQAMRSLQQALQNLQQLTGGSATPAPENRQTGEQPGVGLSAGQSHPRPEPGSNSPGPASSGNGSSGNASPGQELSGRSSTDGSGEGKLPERSVLERIAEQMGLTLDRPGNPSLKPGSEGAGTSSRQPGQADRTGELPRPTDSGPPDSGRSIPGTEPEPDRSPGGGLQNVPRDTTGTDNFFPKDSTDASPRTPGSSAPGNDTSRSFVPQSNPSTGEIDAVKNGTRDSPKGSMQSLLDWLAGRDQSASNDGSSGSAAGTSQARGATTPGGQAGSDWFPG
ncbi:MAG: hypothetical protein O3B13_17330, partial [Planctomycetota bacterium]|nr:hypothetical protein [Planctomycetota bacterium]